MFVKVEKRSQKLCEIYLNFETIVYICSPFAGVVELVDTLDLGSSAARCESSSLSARTKWKIFSKARQNCLAFLLNIKLQT